MIKIDSKNECWCASNKNFGDCCGKIIKEISSQKRVNLVHDYIEKEKYKNALDIQVANYVEYMIKVKSHTEPLFLQAPDISKFLVEIDIKALSECFDTLLSIIYYGNLTYDFEKLLGKSKDLFFNSTWHERMEFYLILWLSLYVNDKERTTSYIKKNINIRQIKDIEFLELIVSVYSESLSWREKLDICKHLEALIDDPIGKTQYQAIEALIYFELDEKKKTNEIFEKLINTCDQHKKNETDPFKLNLIANNYSLIGKLQNKNELSAKAIKVYEEIIDLDLLNDQGLSNIWWNISDYYFDMNIYKKSMLMCDKSIKLSNLPIAKIDKARALILCEDYQGAKEVLDNLNYSELNSANQKDYLFVYSKLLCYIYDEKIDFIITELKTCDFGIGYFRDSALKAAVMLYEIKESTPLQYDKEKSQKWSDKLNKCFILQPNFMGVGVNINEIIDLFRRK